MSSVFPPSPPISKKHRQLSLSISLDLEGSLRTNYSTLSRTRSDVSITSLVMANCKIPNRLKDKLKLL